MKLNVAQAFELRAEAFRIMTGHMAPGKSASHYSQPAPEDVRTAAFNEWLNKYGTVVQAMTVAAGRILLEHEIQQN